MNIREFVDMRQGLHVTMKPAVNKLKIGDQAVIYKPVGHNGNTKEVIVGQILAAAGKDKFVVSIPRPGGISTRTTVFASQLKPVTAAFKRSHVQINPAFRGQM